MKNMLKLEFNRYQEKLNLEKQRGYYPTEHCMINPIGFKFVMQSQEKIMYYSEMSFDLINRYAIENEIDVVEAYDMFTTNYCSGTLQIEPDCEDLIETVEELEEIEEEPEYTEEELEFKKSKEIEAGDDIVDDAEGYSDFLVKFFDNLEKGVIASIGTIDKSYTQKTFGDFLRDMFNRVNTFSFTKQVKKYIKVDLIKGMDSAEQETGIDIGFTNSYKEKLNLLAAQQIDGYTINGKKWFGIKGVTKEIQATIIQTVQSGISENKSLLEIKTAVKEDFNSFSDWRANMIARTETNRIINSGKIVGYKETGINGVKVWSTAPFESGRSSDICQRLSNQERELDEDFIDPLTMKSYPHPPSHPNCRSSIFFKPTSKK